MEDINTNGEKSPFEIRQIFIHHMSYLSYSYNFPTISPQGGAPVSCSREVGANKSNFTMVYGIYIYQYLLWFLNQLITGGYIYINGLMNGGYIELAI